MSKQHSWEEVERQGNITVWKCQNCEATVSTAPGARPGDYRGLVPPFDVCSKNREKIMDNFKEAETVAKALVN